MKWLIPCISSGGIVLACAGACSPVSTPDEVAPPLNVCPGRPCDGYQQEGLTPTCQVGRCEAGRPVYDYVLVASLSATSFFAAGHDFVLRSRDFTSAKGNALCPAISCILLPALTDVTLEVAATLDAEARVQFGLDGSETPVTLPSNAEYRFLDADFLLPVAAKKRVDEATTRGPAGTSTLILHALLPPGRYVRAAFPDPPFASAYPPVFATLSVGGKAQSERVVIGGDQAALDDGSGSARVARIARSGGLDGFVAYLADAATGERISSVRSLHGLESVVRLDTVGANEDGALRPNVDIVVDPVGAGLGIPKLVDSIINGTGFVQRYPELPSPTRISGRVVGPAGEGARSDVVFESQSIDRLPPDKGTTSLRYFASVKTDPTGTFRTVLPPGNYSVTALPDRFGRRTRTVVVEGATQSVQLDVEARASLSGFLRTADGRPLARAEVLATPSSSQPERPLLRMARAPWAFPRAAHAAVSAEGRYELSVDEGSYDLSIEPADGSGFPRIVSPNRRVAPGNATVEPLVVPAPLKIAYSMRDPEGRNAIQRAVIRVFTNATSTGQLLEVGRAQTDAEGKFEVLVAPPPN